MLVAGVVIETLPGKMESVRESLGRETEGLTFKGDDGDRRLAAVWISQDGGALEKWAQRIVQSNDDVLGLYPTFAGEEPGEVPG